MYQLTDKHIDYILNDISARGVELESLQQNLLDHVCCIIEQNLEENGDFESFYQKIIQTFYKDALWEIEEETLLLLTFKNYYAMKKIMIASGIFAVTNMVFGIWFKYMHWPGAALLLPLGILSGSLLFLPLLFALKVKEQQTLKDKIALATGTLSAILLSLSFVFKIMNWPHSMDMLYTSAALTLLVFMPVYVFNGLRNPATKTNTIITSFLVIMGYTLLFSLVRTPQSERLLNLVLTNDFMRNEMILKRQLLQVTTRKSNDLLYPVSSKTGQRIQALCEEAKSAIIESQTGHKSISENFESSNILLQDHYVDAEGTATGKILDKIKDLVAEYNTAQANGADRIPTKASFLQKDSFAFTRSIILLNEITQVQLFLLQNDMQELAAKNKKI